MAARASMAALIARLRVVIGDPAGASQVFTDDDLEDFLDERRFDVDVAVLRADLLVTSGNPTVFRAPVLWWEADVVVANGSGTALTPAVLGTDILRGVWTFATAPGTVYITGRHYDLYGAASAVCTAWAAKVATQFDFASDNQRFDRSQKREGLLAVAREYARKAISPGMRPTWGNPTWES